MSAQAQLFTDKELLTQKEDAVKLATVLKNMYRLLQETGTQAFCRRRPDGSPGCGQEIFFIPIKGGRIRALDDLGNTHKCRESKP